MAHSCSTVNETQHFTYIWTLENICDPFLSFDSPSFTVKEMEMTRWYIIVFMGDSKFIGLNIWREEDDGPKVVEIKFELSILGINGLPLNEKGDIKKFQTGSVLILDGFADKHEVFVRRRAEFLPKDALTIRCRMWRTGTEISQIDSCFARTRLRPDRHFFVWAIREFSTLQRNEIRKIVLKKKDPSNELTLNLFVTENDGEEYIKISLESSDQEACSIKISLLDFEGKVVHFVERKKYYGEVNKIVNFIEKGRLINDEESLIPNNVMELRVEIEEDAKVVWSRIENYRYFNLKSYRVDASGEGDVLYLEHDETSDVPSSFTEAMKSLQEEGTLSDVSLRTDSKSFPAHKCILSAISPVFKAMFTGDMKEKTSKSVEIPDVDEDALGELLSYIYTGRVAKLDWQCTVDLLSAADKYGLLDLKRKCSNFLKSDFSTSNVCAIFNIADLHHDTELREAAQDFVMQTGKYFFTTDEWRNFKKENSELACELVEHLLSNMKRQ